MPDLLDSSVWIPLCAPDHIHHVRARRYWEFEAAAEIAFCRITALSLLRQLTNRHVFRDDALDGKSAWRALETWLATTGVVFLPEPAGIEECLRQWSKYHDLQGGDWTDAYLAAFALASGCRLVAFDDDFRKYAGLDFIHLQA